jgi:TRAP-type C4-dicarboxylate transport system permease small subunit
MRAAAPPAVRRLLAAWHDLECRVAVGAFGAIALVLIADLIGRELFGRLLPALGLGTVAGGIQGAPKLAVYALLIATCAGIGVAAGSGTHLVPRVGWIAVPSAWSDRMDRLADAVTALLLGAAAWYAALMVRDSYQSGLLAPMLQWPLWPVQLVLPLGMASAALRHLCFALWSDLRPPRVGARL